MTEDYGFSDLEEGSLYVYKKGTLREVETDPEDLMKRIKITPDAFVDVTNLQRGMRKALQGYRPDISIICSALLANAAQSSEAPNIVRRYVLEMYQRASEDVA